MTGLTHFFTRVTNFIKGKGIIYLGIDRYRSILGALHTQKKQQFYTMKLYIKIVSVVLLKKL